MSKISDLLAIASESVDQSQEHEFGFFPNFVAQDINAKTGVKLNGVSRYLTTSGINHILKTHGNHKIESERGQKGVTNADIELIPNIVSNFDKVEKGHESRGAKGILFSKTINNVEYYVAMKLFSNSGKSRLEVSTMYAKPKKADV